MGRCAITPDSGLCQSRPSNRSVLLHRENGIPAFYRAVLRGSKVNRADYARRPRQGCGGGVRTGRTAAAMDTEASTGVAWTKPVAKPAARKTAVIATRFAGAVALTRKSIRSIKRVSTAAASAPTLTSEQTTTNWINDQGGSFRYVYMRLVEEFVQDARFAMRSMQRAPGFTPPAIS